jgi:hypothetical protein
MIMNDENVEGKVPDLYQATISESSWGLWRNHKNELRKMSYAENLNRDLPNTN